MAVMPVGRVKGAAGFASPAGVASAFLSVASPALAGGNGFNSPAAREKEVLQPRRD